MQKGNIAVQSENIFPIIKKFLYTEHEIFLRELISNAVDATQKLKTLSLKGEVKGDVGETHINILIDKEAKTITIRDRGIGMSEEEVLKYINQVAFSSAGDFLEKYKDDAKIIGHFGLGFYSAFMVAHKVELHTKSYSGAKAVQWACMGDPEFEMDKSDKKERGTDVVLHIDEDSVEYLEEWKISELLNKYCKFLPVEIQFGTEKVKEGEEEIEKPKIINNTSPAWTKSPTDLKDEDYLAFYKELYPYAEDPLFWIHLNVDYPFNLTGVLYFPKIKEGIQLEKNKIQLYCNQVFVTDSVEEIVPEWLTLLHGVIDSPDIPLNVSRSYLQGDQNVKKINGHISTKVAKKLEELFKKDRKSFEEKWDSIGLFVKYGMVSDEKFQEKIKDYCLFKMTDNTYLTEKEFVEKTKENQTDKDGNLIRLYANNAEDQHSYIENATKKGYQVILFDSIIDNHFVSQMEGKLEKTSFTRVDSDILENIIKKDETEQVAVLTDTEQEKIKELFEEKAKERNLSVQLQPLSLDDNPVLITQPEFSRRMQEMSSFSGGAGMPEFLNLVVNVNHPVAAKILKMKSAEKKTSYVNQLCDLALLSQNKLKGKSLADFIGRSVDILKD